MSIEEVAKRVSQACDQASKCRDALGQAQDLAEQAHDLLAANLRGAVDLESDTERTLATFTAVKDGITDLWKTLGTGMDRAQAALTAITGENHAPPAPDAQRPAQPPQQPSPPPARQVEPDDPPAVPQERIEQLRRELPPPITRTNTGQKTHGRWIGPDGTVQEIVSGKDGNAKLVDDRLERIDMPGRTARASDVEMKLAAHMAETGIKHATVVINYEPCRGRFGCDTLVPILLPEGATLTVHGTTREGQPFFKRYTGGARPWWR